MIFRKRRRYQINLRTTSFLPPGTSTPFRLKPEGSVESWWRNGGICGACEEEGMCRVTAVFEGWANISSHVICSRSKSPGDVWCHPAYVCTRICPIYWWYMKVLRTFRKCFTLQLVFDESVRDLQQLSVSLQNDWFKGENSYPDTICQVETKVDSFGQTHKANTGLSWVHITTAIWNFSKSSPTQE